MLNVHLLIKDKIKRVYKQFPIRIGKKKKKKFIEKLLKTKDCVIYRKNIEPLWSLPVIYNIRNGKKIWNDVKEIGKCTGW